jgi:hypothetical protein
MTATSRLYTAAHIEALEEHHDRYDNFPVGAILWHDGRLEYVTVVEAASPSGGFYLVIALDHAYPRHYFASAARLHLDPTELSN